MISRIGWAILLVSLVACGSVVADKPVCGDGVVTGTEKCDEGAANGQPSSCCSATCTFVAAGAICRDAAGTCDVAETCSGASGACPADAVVADGAPCTGNGANTCSLADTCMAGTCANNDKTAGTACGSDSCHFETCSGTGACPAAGAQTIAIIESSTTNSAETMDVKWKTVADGLGHTSTIYPQTQLDNLANLSTATLLIVSSGTITLSQARRDVVAAFLASGRGVYVQGEYLATYEGNVLFAQIANANGASFAWGAAISGMFNAVPDSCYATTPNAAATPFSQNFAVTGAAAGPGVHPVQLDQATSQPVAFSFCRSGGGLIIVKTDQDDIRVSTGSVPDLMTNILYRLSHSSTCLQ
jgi:hypothetical protein